MTHLVDKQDLIRGFDTAAIHARQQVDPSTNAVITPIYATSTYSQDAPGVHKGLDYGRSHNPTRFAFERAIAALEGGEAGFAFSSGLAAIATVLELVETGSHIIAMDDIYGGTYRLFERVRKKSAGIDISYVDLTDPELFRTALRPSSRIVWIETPTNPLLKLADIWAIATIAHQHGLIVVVDNTFASPWVQRPLELGADIVVHSATKYINGHSDVIGGVVVASNDKIVEDKPFVNHLTRRDGDAIVSLAESLGGFETLVAHPATMTHAAMDADAQKTAGISDRLLRLSVGLEALKDLTSELDRAFAAAGFDVGAKKRKSRENDVRLRPTSLIKQGGIRSASGLRNGLGT